MPPACPVDIYACCYKPPARPEKSPHSPATAEPSPVNGKGKVMMGSVGCSSERDAPPGKPVASYDLLPTVVSRSCRTPPTGAVERDNGLRK